MTIPRQGLSSVVTEASGGPATIFPTWWKRGKQKNEKFYLFIASLQMASKLTIQRDIIHRPNPIPSDSAPCMFRNRAVLVSSWALLLPIQKLQWAMKLLWTHLLSWHFTEPLRWHLGLCWKLCHSSSWIKDNDKDRPIGEFFRMQV